VSPHPKTETGLIKTVSWVVYRKTVHGRGGASPGANPVCEQREWDRFERKRPGYHRLIRDGITSGSEAEKLARGAPGTHPSSKP
jgi:hypothetical protein